MAYDEDLARRVRAHLENVQGLAEKKMFGGIGFLVNGNMACGVHGQDLIVRLDPQAHQQALARPGVRIFDMTGRPMKGWVLVSPVGVESEEALRSWVQQGLDFARSLPAK